MTKKVNVNIEAPEGVDVVVNITHPASPVTLLNENTSGYIATELSLGEQKPESETTTNMKENEFVELPDIMIMDDIMDEAGDDENINVSQPVIEHAAKNTKHSIRIRTGLQVEGPQTKDFV